MDKARKKKLKKQVRAEERRRFREAMPISTDDARSLFAFLGVHLAQSRCDHTLLMTDDWCQLHDVDRDAVIAWLADNGGFCDCEVWYNVPEQVEDAMLGLPSPDQT